MKFIDRFRVIAIVSMMACVSGCTDPAGGALPNGDAPAGPSGTIRGRVVLQGDAPKPASDTIGQDQKVCGSSVSLPRIALGKDNGVQGTFLILEGVAKPSGVRPTPTTQSVLIDQKDCQYAPHT